MGQSGVNLSLVSLREHAKPLDVRTFVVGLAAWAVSASITFRFVILSSFDLVFGDRGDGRLNVYFHEHLFNALCGRAEFLSPPFFYPQRNVLGFSDAVLLDVPPYAALRMIGLDPFLSFQILAIVLSLCCFLASLIICKRYLRLRSAIAICASALITFPNNLIFGTNGAAHLQFFAIYYVPGIALLALWGIEDFPRVTRWSLPRVAVAAALFALLFATGFYVAWLFSLTAIIALCVVGIILRGDLIVMAREYRKPATKIVIAATLGFVVGLIPLALIYAPVWAILSGRTFREYIFFAPFLKDVIDVGGWNMVWGWLVERLLGGGGPERTLAVTPGMTAIFLILAYRLRKDANDPSNRPWQPVFFVACAIVWSFSWLVTARIGTFSLFWLPYHFVPGAAAIRAGGRIQLLVNLWVVAGLAVMLQYWIDTAPRARLRPRILLSSAILIFCLIEQINLQPVNRLSRSSEFAWLSVVPKPPPECRAFLVDIPVQPANYLDENDAMWISWQTGLPTLNGSSGWDPPGWHLDDPKADYFNAARQWIAETGLKQQICVYDRSARSWSKFQ